MAGYSIIGVVRGSCAVRLSTRFVVSRHLQYGNDYDRQTLTRKSCKAGQDSLGYTFSFDYFPTGLFFLRNLNNAEAKQHHARGFRDEFRLHAVTPAFTRYCTGLRSSGGFCAPSASVLCMKPTRPYGSLCAYWAQVIFFIWPIGSQRLAVLKSLATENHFACTRPWLFSSSIPRPGSWP